MKKTILKASLKNYQGLRDALFNMPKNPFKQRVIENGFEVYAMLKDKITEKVVLRYENDNGRISLEYEEQLFPNF